jgi:uncharacterized protein (TIGR03067 family)
MDIVMAQIHILAVSAICLAAGCDSRSDLEKLQGKWQLHEMRGSFDFGARLSKAGPTLLTFTDDGLVYLPSPDWNQRIEGTFTCDTTTRPSRVVFAFGGRTTVGIYSVSGGSLRLCFGLDDKVPPGVFEAGEGHSARPALLLYHRIAP